MDKVLERAKAKKRTVIYSDTGRGDASSFKNYKPAPKAYSTNTSDGGSDNESDDDLFDNSCHGLLEYPDGKLSKMGKK